jgi:hypothetical protein
LTLVWFAFTIRLAWSSSTCREMIDRARMSLLAEFWLEKTEKSEKMKTQEIETKITRY